MARRAHSGPLPEAPENPSVGRTSIADFSHGRKWLELCYDIAQGDWNFTELADATGLSLSDIRQFADDNAKEIQECRMALLNQLASEAAGLWISDKKKRIAELQGMYEQTEAVLYMFNGDGQAPTWSKAHKDIIHTAMGLLRQVADEVGAYPQRAQQPARTGSTVHYVIETEPDDLEQLR
jgi:hypothetical protein